MNFPAELKYTTNDEWIRVEGDSGVVGLTDYAQDQLSDIVYVEFSGAPGQQIAKGAGFASVESVKAAADVYMPVDGEILETNAQLPTQPESINSDPYGAAWLAKIKIRDATQLDGLMDAAAYEAFCQERQA
ncbi:MAG: glycine cleavage system protein GcvH [Anaerolineales bacterium]|nr:glycine cleavage system protein GcvH [Anaerolineales bacterium]MCW5854752.1 glycine cleavage system protein GcvH [Anaerolineales bacterium]